MDYFAEREETFVDFDRLFLGDAFGLGQTLALGTCQVNNLKLADNRVVWVAHQDLFNGEVEDGVRARRCHVHLVTAHRLILESVVE